jgi:hypothetical protein
MRIPVVRGVIERRILVNYRVDPAVLANLLPSPFRPKIVRGYAIVGICLIRLNSLRPRSLPSLIGVCSENAAHRAAVEWDTSGATHEGVFIWRRDTDSRLSACAGGRLFPGVHYHAKFAVDESTDQISIALRSDDGVTDVSVSGRSFSLLPANSVFTSLDECSRFFENGSLGYSATPDPTLHQGLELRCRNWRAEPLAIDKVHSTFFDEPLHFPLGSIEFDSALVMRHIEHEWHGQDDLCCMVT